MRVRPGLWGFFFKQKTAYEMRISDWSSDVCSSDLSGAAAGAAIRAAAIEAMGSRVRMMRSCVRGRRDASPFHLPCHLLGARALGQELGRASCRERVCQYV